MTAEIIDFQIVRQKAKSSGCESLQEQKVSDSQKRDQTDELCTLQDQQDQTQRTVHASHSHLHPSEHSNEGALFQGRRVVWSSPVYLTRAFYKMSPQEQAEHLDYMKEQYGDTEFVRLGSS